MIWVALAFAVVAAVFDLRSREIPDGLSAALILAAVVAVLFGYSELSWLQVVGGAAVGFAIPLLLFGFGILGGGDVKLLTGIGAAVGPLLAASVLFWSGVFGGVLGLWALARGKKDLAYVPAIAAGLLMVSVLQAGLSHAILKP